MRAALLLSCFFLLRCTMVSGQCNSQRYIDTVFHEVDVTYQIPFATATPYGALAQPQELKLNFYEPHGDTLSKRPLVVYAFGGGFLIGDKAQPPIPKMAEYFAQLGFCFAAIDYRIGFNTLSSGSAERAVYRAIQDERSALRYLAQHCDQYRIDTNFIFLSGSSAGCFSAFHQSYMLESDRPTSTYGIPLEPDDLGCVDCSGNTDYGNRKLQVRGIVNLWGAMLDTTYISSAPEDNVPVISFHGTNDNAVPYVQGYPFSYPVFPTVYGSLLIHQRLNTLGIVNELHPLNGYGHEPELLAPELNDTIWNYSKVFLQKLMKPQPPQIFGEVQACVGGVYTYFAPAHVGSKYCWEITGDYTLLNETWNSITLQWNDTGMVEIELTELSHLQVTSEPYVLSISIHQQPVAGFSFSANELQVEIVNESLNASEWMYMAGSTTLLMEEPQFTFSHPGNYNITQVVSNGYCSDTLTQTLAVDTCPVATISYTQNGNVFQFQAASSNATNFHWYFGDGDSSATQNASHTFTTNGPYVVTLLVENSLGCVAGGTVIIVINHLPEPALTEVPVLVFGGQLQIRINASRFSISNLNGQMMYSGSVKEIDCSQWNNGIYLFTASTATGSLQYKFLVQH